MSDKKNTGPGDMSPVALAMNSLGCNPSDDEPKPDMIKVRCKAVRCKAISSCKQIPRHLWRYIPSTTCLCSGRGYTWEHKDNDETQKT